ncbi:MAG TPA: DUF5915 domain-containing protein, partial [Actinomycetota bacterium]|nr:DUF5915 domain-containing protein [Actinomycetota bacterium]
TLYETLVTVAKLVAPILPFMAEEMYQNLVRSVDSSADSSVHHCHYPEVNEALGDPGLERDMDLVRRVVELGLAARGASKIKVRQPLPRALALVPAAERVGVEAMASLIAEELNVKEVALVESLEELVHYSVKPNFRALGPRFGGRMPKVAAALAALGPEALTALREELAAGGPAHLTVEGEEVELGPADVEVRAEKREGYEVEHTGPYAVALDIDITPELRAEGLAREVVRAVQDARKEANLDIADWIRLQLGAGGELAAAIDTHQAWIMAEVLATERAVSPLDGFVKTTDVEGEPMTIGIVKA